MDERTLRIIVVSATLATLGVFREPIMRWLRSIGYTGSGLGRDRRKDKPEESGNEKSP